MSQSDGTTEPPPDTHAKQFVKVTGVNLGNDDVSSPPSGASMIHSMELPLKFAGDGLPGAAGGARVMLKCELLVLFVIMMLPEIWLL